MQMHRFQHHSRLFIVRCMQHYGKALSKSSITFISQAAFDDKVHEKLGIGKNDSSCSWNSKINEKRYEA